MSGEQMAIPLPGEPDVPPVPVAEAPEAVRWSRYTAKHRHRCDHCVRAQHADRSAPAARTARWRRKGAGLDELLCDGHAEAAREVDGYRRDKTGRWVREEDR